MITPHMTWCIGEHDENTDGCQRGGTVDGMFVGVLGLPGDNVTLVVDGGELVDEDAPTFLALVTEACARLAESAVEMTDEWMEEHYPTCEYGLCIEFGQRVVSPYPDDDGEIVVLCEEHQKGEG